jgi:glutamate 5-kinase
LLKLGVIPVINENDTVATDEIRFGDNDTLAALVANFTEADLLIILTDQSGLYESDPRQNPDAQLVKLASAGDVSLKQMAGSSGGLLGRGGMYTKVCAAERASRSGAATWIAGGRIEGVLEKIAAGSDIGTLLTPSQQPLVARKQWLASHLKVKGKLHLDEGAAKVLSSQGRSLLPVGVSHVEGSFKRGELVSCIAPDGTEIARGLVNYNSDEADRLAGHSSDKIESLLGYVDEPELIHRDDLVLMV